MSVGAAVALVFLAAAADRPAWIGEAVALGSTKAPLDVYRVGGDVAVEYTTPFLRVARAANKIVREGRIPRAQDIEAKAWVPELRVLAGVLPVTETGRPAAFAAPRSARLILGAAEAKATRMETGTEKQVVSLDGGAPQTINGGTLKAVFEVRGQAPLGAELEVRYVLSRGGRDQEIVKRVPIDFRKTRW